MNSGLEGPLPAKRRQSRLHFLFVMNSDKCLVQNSSLRVPSLIWHNQGFTDFKERNERSPCGGHIVMGVLGIANIA
jgi:hypothetical protein